MGILGLSSLDALISLMLIETGWWGKLFLGYTLPITVATHFYGMRPLGYFDLFIFVLLLSKFLCPGIVWHTFFQNQTGNHAVPLKFWYWVSMILDLIAIAYVESFNILHGRYFHAIIGGLANAFVRSFIWIIGKRLVWDLSTRENDKALFPQGFIAYLTDFTRVQVTLTVLLVAEFLYYAISLIGTILKQNRIGAIVLPMDDGGGLLIVCIALVMPVIVILVQLIGVVQGWKAFLKFWFFAYILLNFIVYFLCFPELYYTVRQMPFHVLFWISFVSKLTLPVSGLALKFGVIFGSYVYLFKSESNSSVSEEQVYKDEEKPLIFPPNK